MADLVESSSLGIGGPESLATKTIDIANRRTGIGAANASMFSVINGLSIYGGLAKVPVNTNKQGYTFFTRPQLNLSYDNVITSRRMSAYAVQRPDNMANVIRCYLQPPGFIDPTVQASKIQSGLGVDKQLEPDVRSIIVDDKNPFITVLSNTLLSISGFPDFAPDLYTSPEGLAKEVVSWIDDRPYQYGPFTMAANFANMEGDMLTHLYHCWIEYATRVAEGSMLPFPVNVIENRIDYDTRIYRFVMDRTNTFVQHTASTIAFPVEVPIGAVFNFNVEDKLTDAANQTTMSFQCMGVEYNDPINIFEFNKLVGRFNPDMQTVESRAATMHKVTDAEKPLMNYKAYPYISETMELEWWIPFAIYQEIYDLLEKAKVR